MEFYFRQKEKGLNDVTKNAENTSDWFLDTASITRDYVSNKRRISSTLRDKIFLSRFAVDDKLSKVITRERERRGERSKNITIFIWTARRFVERSVNS